MLTHYQTWSGGWTGPRLWIGSSQYNGNYHGDSCVDCVVTWKNTNGGDPGVYSSVSSSGNNSGNGDFWLR